VSEDKDGMDGKKLAGVRALNELALDIVTMAGMADEAWVVACNGELVMIEFRRPDGQPEWRWYGPLEDCVNNRPVAAKQLFDSNAARKPKIVLH